MRQMYVREIVWTVMGQGMAEMIDKEGVSHSLHRWQDTFEQVSVKLSTKWYTGTVSNSPRYPCMFSSCPRSGRWVLGRLWRSHSNGRKDLSFLWRWCPNILAGLLARSIQHGLCVSRRDLLRRESREGMPYSSSRVRVILPHRRVRCIISGRLQVPSYSNTCGNNWALAMH